MKASTSFLRTPRLNLAAPYRITACAKGLLLLLLLLVLPAVTQAQDYIYTTNNGTITIKRYIGSGGVVEIPDEINGLPVTSIGDSAFSSCVSLSKFTIPNSVTSIESWAFGGCTSLTSVTIPNTVNSIGVSPFHGCSSLTTITVDPLNPAYASLDGVLLNKSQTRLMEFPGGNAGSYTVPDSVRSIDYAAFSGCGRLTNVCIGNNVTNIVDYAFSGCSGMTSVTIGKSVTSIGSYAFIRCEKLTSLTIPDSVTNIGGHAFHFCNSLTNATIGSSVTSIGDEAFSYCGSLTEVYFKGNAPSLVGYLFYQPLNKIVYYMPGTTGWGAFFGFCPTAPWPLPYPVVLTAAPNFGIQANGFGFTISWITNAPVVVEVSANLTNPTWTPVSTNILTSGSSYFSDPQWTNYPGRFYRIRSL